MSEADRDALIRSAFRIQTMRFGDKITLQRAAPKNRVEGPKWEIVIARENGTHYVDFSSSPAGGGVITGAPRSNITRPDTDSFNEAVLFAECLEANEARFAK